MFKRTAIIGVGLIGASFALGIKKYGLCSEIAGFGRNKTNLERAEERGIIDSFYLDPYDACSGSDLIVFSVPVGNILELVGKSLPAFMEGAVVTDVGSVKGKLVSEIEKIMPKQAHYIGSHPIAGSEKSGIDASNAELFGNAKCIVTPTRNSSTRALKLVSDIWRKLGSRVIHMDPDTHDRIYASVSHLPHVIAYTIINTVADIDKKHLEYGGQGFLDTTRIASGSPEMWRDICAMIKDNIIESIDVFQKKLLALREYLRADEYDSVESEFIKARTLREGIGQD
jgi:prephenate dehydrogenase